MCNLSPYDQRRAPKKESKPYSCQKNETENLKNKPSHEKGTENTLPGTRGEGGTQSTYEISPIHREEPGKRPFTIRFLPKGARIPTKNRRSGTEDLHHCHTTKLHTRERRRAESAQCRTSPSSPTNRISPEPQTDPRRQSNSNPLNSKHNPEEEKEIKKRLRTLGCIE